MNKYTLLTQAHTWQRI